jgi:hypothetical protein
MLQTCSQESENTWNNKSVVVAESGDRAGDKGETNVEPGAETRVRQRWSQGNRQEWRQGCRQGSRQGWIQAWRGMMDIGIADFCLSQDVRKLFVGTFPWIFRLYAINEAQKQYSLLHTIFNCICYFGPPGKRLCLSPPKPLHVGRRSRPTCIRVSWIVYRCFPGGLK